VLVTATPAGGAELRQGKGGDRPMAGIESVTSIFSERVQGELLAYACTYALSFEDE